MNLQAGISQSIGIPIYHDVQIMSHLTSHLVPNLRINPQMKSYESIRVKAKGALAPFGYFHVHTDQVIDTQVMTYVMTHHEDIYMSSLVQVEMMKYRCVT